MRIASIRSDFNERHPRHLTTRPQLSQRIGSLAVVAVAALGLAGTPPAQVAHAASYDVTSGEDSGPGTLRTVIEEIDPSDDDPVVTIAPGLTITLKYGVVIPDKLTIRGDPFDLPEIVFDESEGRNHTEVFHHSGEQLDFSAEYFAVRGIPEDENGDGNIWGAIVEGGSATRLDVTLEGIEAVGVGSAVNAQSSPEATVLIDNSSFTGVGNYRDGESSLVELPWPFDGSLTVRDSHFERVWPHVTWVSLGEGTVNIERSTFDNHGLGSRENLASVLAVEFEPATKRATVPVTVRDSSFTGLGGDNAGAFYFESHDVLVGSPIAVEISGSTFIDTDSNDWSPNAFVMAIEDPDTSVVVQNSTFKLAEVGENKGHDEGVVQQYSRNTARLVMDHVTAVGPGISAEEAAFVTVQDSAFITDEAGIVMHVADYWSIEEGEENDLTELDTSGVVIERTLISTPGPRFPDEQATPEELFQLSELGDHGGPTPTMLPGPESALIDAAGGHTAVDQRGMPRPAGRAPDAGAVEAQPATVSLLADVTVPEGQPLTFVAQREGGEPSYPAAASFATADGTAVSPTNYAATSGSLTWAPGESEPKHITVASTPDGKVTDPLTFTINLSDPGATTVIAEGAGSRTGTLTNTDTGEIVPPGPDPDPDPEPGTDPTPKPDPAPGKGLANSGSADHAWLLLLAALSVAAGTFTWVRMAKRR